MTEKNGELCLNVFHGRENHCEIQEDIVFFSSNEDFSKNYGEVKSYKITLNNPFHTCLEKDVAAILSKVGVLYDEHSEEEFSAFAELKESRLLYHDTWEIFEPFINQIKSLGYDGMVIYEGGIENYICFDSSQYTLN